MSTTQPPARDSDAVASAEAAIPPPPPLGAGTVPFPAPPPVQMVPPPPPGLPGTQAPPRQTPPAPPWISLDRPAAPPPPAPPQPAPTPLIAAPSAPEEPGVTDDAEVMDRTVVVDRRPVVPWHLVIDGGPTLRLVGSRIVLGRRPAGAGDGAHELAIPDATRTLSKVHARLDLVGGVWTVTDLNATNGVIVIDADGAERLLDPGASAELHERFVLGKVAMRVTAEKDVAS